ncbi:hypothetical protein EXN66_Car011756 [Channa argus]|uniref:Uncharacterized protein n=1 Tax=Channa argus TaxID=215402 RepID=A0A6G1Q0F7_CHAAH|nr:hypothetical protein EXN66_Car011756 [Channa argus]
MFLVIFVFLMKSPDVPNGADVCNISLKQMYRDTIKTRDTRLYLIILVKLVYEYPALLLET